MFISSRVLGDMPTGRLWPDPFLIYGPFSKHNKLWLNLFDVLQVAARRLKAFFERNPRATTCRGHRKRITLQLHASRFVIGA